jgi:hypothetical protein
MAEWIVTTFSKTTRLWISNMTEETKTEWVLVDCVSTFRMRYMVEVPVGKDEWALDTVEFSQEHLGEQIVSHRVVSMADALAICDKDNDYCAGWTDEQKHSAFFTRNGEKVEL